MAYTKKTSFPTSEECHAAYMQAYAATSPPMHGAGLEAVRALFVDRDAEALALLREARRYVLDLYGSADLPADMRKDSVLARIESLLATSSSSSPVPDQPACAPFRFSRTYMGGQIVADHGNMERLEEHLNRTLDRLVLLEDKARAGRV